MTSLSMVGCDHSTDRRPIITYGTLVDNEATELIYDTLLEKVSDKENFLISVYDDSSNCGCWTTFHYVINQYVQTYHTKIYYIARSQFSEDADTFGLATKIDSSKPIFALMKEGKQTSQFVYGDDTKTMFESLDGLRSAVSRIARDPQFMFVNQKYLDNALFTEKKDEVVVQYIWRTCPDCNDCFPNVMVPYSQKFEFKNPVWLIDLEIKGLLLNDAGEKDKTNASYVKFLKDHHMSAVGDEYFGYDRGFVPTTQVWRNGELKDMNVYFNDEIQVVDGKYVITRSYYNETNASKFAYTNTVLQGKELSEEELDIYPEYNYVGWNKEYARKQHQPILESFLDMYVKK